MDEMKKDRDIMNGKGESDDIEWITVNGSHIPLKNGENPKVAIKKHFENNKPNASKNKYFIEKIDINNKEVLNSKIESYASRIVKDSKEHHILIDKNGNVYEQTGTETRVAGFENVDMNGTISLHNHSEGGSFGEDDFIFYRDKPNSEFICVTQNYTYKLKVLKEIDKPYNYFYVNCLKNVFDTSLITDYKEIVCECVKEEGYIKYEKIDRNP